jgi:hypothetical protein
VFLPRIDNISIVVVFAAFATFSIYNYRHLPMIDFLGWKTGTNLIPDHPVQPKVYLTYRNKITGEEKEYLSTNYPWNDSTWTAQWEFKDQRIDNSGVIKGHNLKIFDTSGIDLTDNFINKPGYASYSLEDASRKGFGKIDRLYDYIIKNGHSLIVLTGSLQAEIDSFRKGLHPDLEFYQADDIELKMMVRANPGLILLKNGVVMGKWHWRDVPGYEQLQKEFPGL